MTPRHTTDRGRIYEARAEAIYPLLEPGSVQLVMCDGPYALQMAEWDSMDVADLPEWYRPHIAAWDRICAPSASTYVWGTAASWAAIHPEMLAAGWGFRRLIVWHKTNAQQQKAVKDVRTWPQMTEVCGMYQREGFPKECAIMRRQADLNYSELAGLLGVDSRLPALWEGYPSVHGSCAPNREQWDVLALSAELPNMATDAMWHKYGPAPFTLPPGVTNVWHHPIVAGSERLRDRAGKPLHKCQKPLALVRRMILASTRPGGLVCAPFGGTLREALVCEQLSPSHARRYITSEINDDGVDYLGPAIEELEAARSQPHLFGAPAQDSSTTKPEGQVPLW